MLRRLLFLGLVVAFVWVVHSRFDEIRDLTATLLAGRWPWILSAILLQIVYWVSYALLFRASFAVVGVHSPLRSLIPLVLASVFVNSATPSGGTGGIALFVDDARRRGQSAARAAAGMLLVNIADFGSFLVVLTVGLVILLLLHDLVVYEIVTAFLMYTYVGVMVAVLLLGLWRPDRLRRLLKRVQQGVNRVGAWLRYPTILDENWSDNNSREFEAAANQIAAHPDRLLEMSGIGLIAHVINICTLYSIFLAFNIKGSLGIIIAGYAMTRLFWIISPTPNGIGIVEALMPVVYTSLGLETAGATIITVAYRGISFWFPFVLGFFLLRR
ncbi:MAG: flippase-like domain-containing protein, partial [Anaerolineales bacterium]|nr:flippase-like domain-containing protein [Anaerolineales bacterium]